MNLRLWAAIFLAWLGLGALAVCDEEALSLADYANRLHHYQELIHNTPIHPESAVKFRDELPEGLKVRVAGEVHSVSLEFLRKGLNDYLTAPGQAKPDILAQLDRRLGALAAEGQVYEQGVAADPAARARLNNILSTKEFRRSRGPTQWELLWRRIGAWIRKLFFRIFPKVPDIDYAGQVFVWVMIAVAGCVLAVWLYRKSRERILEGPREIVPFMPSSKSWRVWLAEARAQAQTGAWRDAIHLGFWAGVSRLESEGLWRPDKARTPREYLAIIPTENTRQPFFAALTTSFEVFWYGGRPATADDFQRLVRDLEGLGCRE
jgi:hypothetical protein